MTTYVTRSQLAIECGRTPRTLYNYLHRPGVPDLLRARGVDIDVSRNFNPREAQLIRDFLGIE